MGSASGLENWAGNLRFQAAGLLRPTSVADLQRAVAGARRVHALGTAHSFSAVADTTGYLVSVAGLPPRIEVDRERAAVTVSAGLRYSDLGPALQRAGLALLNLGSLPGISVAGAVATGTHGSGDNNGSLASQVAALELVTGEGEALTVSRESDRGRFAGLVVALGACGVVTALTLDTVPAFLLRQYVYEDVPLAAAARHFGEITSSGYSVSMFTDWASDRLSQTWLKLTDSQAPPPPDWLGGRIADAARHPVMGMPPQYCTAQLGQLGPWHERLPHFRAECVASAGDELQSEFLVARERAAEVLAALVAIRAELAPVTQVAEIRTIARDDLWLSPSYQRDSAAFHFTWVPDSQAVRPVLDKVQGVLAPFAARPHWGKIFTVSPTTVASLYPRMKDFRQLATELDPAGKFRNQLIDAILGPLQ